MMVDGRCLVRGLQALGVALLACGALACGGGDHGVNADAGGAEAGVDASGADAGDGGGADGTPGADAGSDADNGAPSTTYPAFQPPVPQLVLTSKNATVLVSPQVRPVYFTGDPSATAVDDALTQWFASPVWAAQTSQYGIGPAKLATPVMLAESPATSLTDADIRTWLAGKLDGTHPEFGPVDAATLAGEMFVISYPPTVAITAFGGTVCPDSPAYHYEMPIGTGKTSYVVVQRCPGETVDVLPFRVEYEVLATAGDPFPMTQSGYGSFDANHLAWDVLIGDTELSGGGFCFANAFGDAGSPLLPYAQAWSNAAMSAYHDPCVPAASSAPYFMSVPVMNDDVTLQGFKSKGIVVPVGKSVAVEVWLLSDGPTSGPWTVDVQVMPGAGAPANALTLALDRPSGTNGEKLHLTVTANQPGSIPLQVTSTLGAKQTFWAGLVGQQ